MAKKGSNNVNEIVFNFSAETNAFIQELIKVDKSFENLTKDGTRNLNSLQDAIKKTFDYLGATTSADEASRLNVFQKELRANERTIRQFGVKPMQDLTDVGRKARNSLTGLSQVARDLPFGFIAISNNIPVLFDALVGLQRESGGTGKAFKALSKELLGPTGVILAFSIISSLVTAVIQKYGGLGNAVKALTSTSSELYEIQKKLNDGFKQAEVKTNELKAQYESLSRITGGFTKELSGYDSIREGIIKSASGYVDAIDKEKVAKVNLGLVTAELIKLERQLAGSKLLGTAIAEANTELEKLKKGGATSITFGDLLGRALRNFTNDWANFFKTIGFTTGNIFEAQKVEVYNSKVNTLTSSVAGLETQLDASNIAVEQSKKNLQALLGTTEEQIKAGKDAARAAKDYKLLFNVFDEFTSLGNIGRRFAFNLDEEQLFKLQDIADRLNKKLKGKLTLSQFISSEEYGKFVSITETRAREAGEKARSAFFDGVRKKVEDSKNLLLQDGEAIMGKDIQLPQWLKDFQEARESEIANNQLLSERYEEIASLIEGYVTPVFTDFFEALINGQNAFKAIKQSLKQMVIELGAAIIKATIFNALMKAIQASGGGFFLKAANFLTGGLNLSGIGRGGLGRLLFGGGTANLAGLGGQAIVLETRVSGNDLLLVQNRALRSQGRMY